MRMNYETQVDAELDAALARTGVNTTTVIGARDAVREFARTITANTDRTPEAALRMAAEAIARTLHLAATAPARSGVIPHVTFLPPPPVREQADLDAITKAITDATAWSQNSVAEATAALAGSFTEPKAVRR